MSGTAPAGPAPVDTLVAPPPEAAAARVTEGFRSAFGYEPAGVWWAPGRVNLIGEHVDYHGGNVMPVALPLGVAAALAPRGDDRVRATSSQQPGAVDLHLADVAPGRVEGWAGYVAGVPWAMRQAGMAATGFDAVLDASVPAGAGLSSSAAVECAIAVALAQLGNLPGAEAEDDAGRAALAAACVQAETRIAGADTGGMDQSIALRAREGHALLLDCQTWQALPLPLDGLLAASGTTILVIDTRAHHSHAGGGYGDRRAVSMRAAQRLGVRTLNQITPQNLTNALDRLADDDERAAVRHVVTEIARVDEFATAMTRREPEAAGAVLIRSHASLRDDYLVSCPELDVAVDASLAAGALGARMTGGGFGGSAIALCATGRAEAVVAEVAERFSDNGWTRPATLSLGNGGGPARRVT